MAGLNFDMGSYEPDAGGFGDPLPEGWYDAMVDESSVEPTKDNATTGNCYAKLRFNIIDGEFKGRKVFKNFNIKNSNPQAEEIGRKQLTAVGHAVGVPNATDTSQLHAVPMHIKVTLRKGGPKDPSNPDGEKYPDQNEISTFKHISEAVPAAGSAKSDGPVNPFAKPPAAAPAKPPAFAAPPATSAPAAAAPAAPVVPPPAPVAAPPVAPAAPVFPPEGWLAHPEAAGYFYKGQEVKTEAELRAMSAPPATPVPPVAPPAIPAAPVVATPATAADPAKQAQGIAPPWAR